MSKEEEINHEIVNEVSAKLIATLFDELQEKFKNKPLNENYFWYILTLFNTTILQTIEKIYDNDEKEFTLNLQQFINFIKEQIGEKNEKPK